MEKTSFVVEVKFDFSITYEKISIRKILEKSDDFENNFLFYGKLKWKKIQWKSVGNVVEKCFYYVLKNQIPVISFINSSISILKSESEVYRRSICSKEEWIVA